MPQRPDLDLASDAPHGKTQVLPLHGLHPESPRSEGCDHCAKFQLIKDRGFVDCIKPDHQAPHVGIASLFSRVPEQDALVACTDHLQCQGLSLWMRTRLQKNIDNHWSTKARAIEQQARAPGRPGHSDEWSARDIRQWVANCVHQLTWSIRDSFTARKQFTCEDEPCLPGDHLFICSQRSAKFVIRLSENACQEDNILGDRECP